LHRVQVSNSSGCTHPPWPVICAVAGRVATLQGTPRAVFAGVAPRAFAFPLSAGVAGSRSIRTPSFAIDIGFD
jgi:hypothetical protein